jgi:protocatechuate 3,4-dioxygenase beta subunit
MPSDPKNFGLAIPDSEILRLRPEAIPTTSYQEDASYLTHLRKVIPSVPAMHDEPVMEPFFRPNAPYRAKITPPHEPGRILVIKGRVWAYDTKEPLSGARMDVWHADAAGRYDNEDAGHPLEEGDFINRARVYCDRGGYYEFETIHPGPYKMMNAWRAPHINFRVEYPGYVTLVTQLFFRGDPYEDKDPYIKESLIINLFDMERYGMTYEEGVFDIVMAAEAPEPY